MEQERDYVPNLRTKYRYDGGKVNFNIRELSVAKIVCVCVSYTHTIILIDKDIHITISQLTHNTNHTYVELSTSRLVYTDQLVKPISFFMYKYLVPYLLQSI